MSSTETQIYSVKYSVFSRSGRPVAGTPVSYAKDQHGKGSLPEPERHDVCSSSHSTSAHVPQPLPTTPRFIVTSLFWHPLCFVQGSLGFPHNVAAERMLEKKAQEEDTRREETESKLKRLLDHRRRLFDVLKASCVSVTSTDGLAFLVATIISATKSEKHKHYEQQQHQQVGRVFSESLGAMSTKEVLL